MSPERTCDYCGQVVIPGSRAKTHAPGCTRPSSPSGKRVGEQITVRNGLAATLRRAATAEVRDAAEIAAELAAREVIEASQKKNDAP